MISVIFAIANNNLVGSTKTSNGIPWDISEDMKYFVEMTRGKPVIAGSKTFKAMGRALPKRENFVATKSESFEIENINVVNDFESFCEGYKNKDEELMIIGGPTIYRAGLKFADNVYVTRINDVFDGDVFWDDVNELLSKDYELVDSKIGEDKRLTFETYKRKG